jgi:hypothetical protein
MEQVANANRYCVCFGFNPSPGLKTRYAHIDFRPMPWHDSQSFGMIQHGRFLDALPHLSDDELINLSDADVLIQRQYTDAEVAFADAIDGNTISAGINSCHAPGGDLLDLEAVRIHYPYVRDDGAKCWNCGNMLGRVSAFRRIQPWYEEDCQDFYRKAPHRSRCQYHFWHSVYRMSPPMNFVQLPNTWHTHGHYGLPNGARIVNRRLFFDGSLVMFAHCIRGLQ